MHSQNQNKGVHGRGRIEHTQEQKSSSALVRLCAPWYETIYASFLRNRGYHLTVISTRYQYHDNHAIMPKDKGCFKGYLGLLGPSNLRRVFLLDGSFNSRDKRTVYLSISSKHFIPDPNITICKGTFCFCKELPMNIKCAFTWYGERDKFQRTGASCKETGVTLSGDGMIGSILKNNMGFVPIALTTHMVVWADSSSAFFMALMH